MRKIHASKRKEKELKKIRQKKLEERAGKLKRFCVYGIVLLCVMIGYLLTQANYISYYMEMSDFKENAELVTAKLVMTDNYEKTIGGKYSRFKPAATEDLTLHYEMEGRPQLKTYKDVYIYSTEANMEENSHIDIYVLPDTSDIQTARVVEECLKEATFHFVIMPGIVAVLWLVCVILLEMKIFRKDAPA